MYQKKKNTDSSAQGKTTGKEQKILEYFQGEANKRYSDGSYYKGRLLETGDEIQRKSSI